MEDWGERGGNELHQVDGGLEQVGDERAELQLDVVELDVRVVAEVVARAPEVVLVREVPNHVQLGADAGSADGVLRVCVVAEGGVEVELHLGRPGELRGRHLQDAAGISDIHLERAIEMRAGVGRREGQEAELAGQTARRGSWRSPRG